MNRILTTPKELQQNEEVLYTGNHYLSLPELSAQEAAIRSLNVISLANKGLLELRGDQDLLRPEFFRNGESLPVKEVKTEMELHFLPVYHYLLADGTQVQTQVYCDFKEKGLICRFTSSAPLEVRVDFRLAEVNFLRFNSHSQPFQRKFSVDKWLNNPTLEITCHQASLALAFGSDDALDYQYAEDQNLILKIACIDEASLYISVNSDPDGASTTLIHLRRKGASKIRQEFAEWLRAKMVRLQDQPKFQDLLNQNLFFNYFFALGKDFATDHWVALTSRSPRYYVSGAFWERDSFLWSLPAVRIIDYPLYKEVAREMIIRHSKNAGDHAHYIDGTVLYPGFELDEAASYLILLPDFAPSEIDRDLLTAIERVYSRIEEEYDPQVGLYKTFLLPSDDPTHYPFVLIDQAILLKGYANLANLYQKLGQGERARELESRIATVKEGIKQHLTKEINGKQMYLWSTDGQGNHLLYNDPPGNLGLLPFYGFTTPDDPVFANTIAYYYSPQYHYFFPKSRVQELACDHHPQTPSGLGLCGSILNPLMQKAALKWLAQIPMDYGLLAESFDRDSGAAKTGIGFATGSGYLAYTLCQALVKGEE